ncbi:sulfite exporter TauE/SafE family protein [Ornithinimicrobium cavernae]|uniref:sulfite exporter TauE/SafE family protein n=1 Tax=Ornithinimicrobium cavernae TaxID=2666047 RepID=UPI000D69B92F|nr:sulfite exporter TauE/SafE family protein [Ornithinimicrobium cavernae]
MSPVDVVLLLLAGLAAGTINTIVGSGTLITFPTLLVLGFPPVVANVSNSLGLVAGGISGAWGYRTEISGLRTLVLRLVPVSVTGAIAGALLLLWLPPEAFEAVVPVLILLAVGLVIIGPWVQRRAADRPAGPEATVRWPLVAAGVLFAGTYGGYFGAAQGVIVLGVLGLLVPIGIQAANGVKNLLGMIVNLVSATVFLMVQPSAIDWTVVLIIAAGSLCGGLVGARIGRRLPSWALRSVVVGVGLIAVAYFAS